MRGVRSRPRERKHGAPKARDEGLRGRPRAVVRLAFAEILNEVWRHHPGPDQRTKRRRNEASRSEACARRDVRGPCHAPRLVQHPGRPGQGCAVSTCGQRRRRHSPRSLVCGGRRSGDRVPALFARVGFSLRLSRQPVWGARGRICLSPPQERRGGAVRAAGTGPIGATIAALAFQPLIGTHQTVWWFQVAFLSSSIPGAVLGYAAVRALRRVPALDSWTARL